MARVYDDLHAFQGNGPKSQRERLARLDALANLMDSAVVIPGTGVRFGADALIGLVPGIGDAVSAGISCMIILEARRMGAPGHVIARMLGNVAIDGLIGVVPLFGDLFDLAFRANLRNMRLLRRHFEKAARD